MGLRFIIGFLIGAGVASVLARRERSKVEVEEPVTTMDEMTSSTSSVIEDVEDSGEGLVEKLRTRLDEAKAAAREESQEKQAELTRRFEETLEREKSD